MTLGGRTLAVGSHVLPAHNHANFVSGLPGNDRAEYQCFSLTEVFTIELVDEPAVILVVVDTHARTEGIAERTADGCHDVGVQPPVTIRVAVNRSACREFQLIGRAPGVDQDRAAGDVTAKQHALRSAQHLDALDIGHVDDDAHVLTLVHAIDEYAYGRIDGWNCAVDAEAPDRKIGGAA